jgi:ferredoxin-NADP reductase
VKTALDHAIGRVTMYRFVTICLAALTVISFASSAAGKITYTPTQLLASLVTLLVVTLFGGKVFALLFRATAHTESSIITALLLFFILSPIQIGASSTDVITLGQIALAGLFASASKYVLAFRGRHIFNPAAVGAVWLMLFHYYLAAWWIGTPVLLPFTAVLVLLVLYRTKRFPLGATFIVIAAVILLTRNLSDGGSFGTALKFAFGQTPLVFFAGFMLTEPLTLPPARWQQLSVAAIVAVLFSVPITLGSYTVGPETALILGNAVAFAFGQRRGIELVLTAKRRLTPSSMEYVFAPVRSLSFTAGQYLELALPHKGSDSRGSRRSFSIASAPGAKSDVGRTATVKIGIKVPERASSFKRAIDELPIGSTLRATGVSGDFVLPKKSDAPLLLVAGGIGITPFVSQLAALPPGHDRDVVLVYVAGDADEIGYRDELAAAGVRTVVVTRDAAAGLPAGFEAVTAPRLTDEVLAAAVPDIARRKVYVSGPPGLVDTISRAARSLKARSISKDYFSGY